MKGNRKRVLALLLVLLLSLSGASAIAVGEAGSTPKPMRYLTPGDMMPDADKVLKAINEKLAADGVDIEVSFIRIPWDAYEQKLNAMLAAGEPFELLHVMQDVQNITSLVSKNAILPLDEYLNKYPDLMSKYSALELQGGTYNGSVYAIPAKWRDLKKPVGNMTVRGDVMERLGLSYPKTAEELLEVCKVMQPSITEEVGKKAYLWVHSVKEPPHFLHMTYDSWPFYVENSMGLTLVRQDGTVDSYYESEEFKKDAEYYRTLYKDGFVHPDILSLTGETKSDAYTMGNFLPSQANNYADQVKLQQNIPDSYFEFFFLAPEKQKLIYTLSQNLNAISSTAEDPESGLKFLNWLYADKANHDLFIYGIEGEHYTASAPNRYQSINGADNKPLYYFDNWMCGLKDYMRFDENYPEAGIVYDTTSMPEDELVVSPAAAFLFDASGVESELVNLQVEIISSMYPIRFGLVDYDTAYPEAIARMKDAGLDRYMEEYRAQFKAFQAQE